MCYIITMAILAVEYYSLVWPLLKTSLSPSFAKRLQVFLVNSYIKKAFNSWAMHISWHSRWNSPSDMFKWSCDHVWHFQLHWSNHLLRPVGFVIVPREYWDLWRNTSQVGVKQAGWGWRITDKCYHATFGMLDFGSEVAAVFHTMVQLMMMWFGCWPLDRVVLSGAPKFVCDIFFPCLSP